MKHSVKSKAIAASMVAGVALAPAVTFISPAVAMADNTTPTSLFKTTDAKEKPERAFTSTVSGVYTADRKELKPNSVSNADLDTKGKFYTADKGVYDRWVNETLDRIGSGWYNWYGSDSSFGQLVDAKVLDGRNGRDAKMTRTNPKSIAKAKGQYSKADDQRKAQIYSLLADFESETRDDAARAAKNTAQRAGDALGGAGNLVKLLDQGINAVHGFLKVPGTIEVKVNKDLGISPARDVSGHELGAISQAKAMDEATKPGKPADEKKLEKAAEDAVADAKSQDEEKEKAPEGAGTETQKAPEQKDESPKSEEAPEEEQKEEPASSKSDDNDAPAASDAAKKLKEAKERAGVK